MFLLIFCKNVCINLILIGRTLVFTLYKIHNGMRSNNVHDEKIPYLKEVKDNFISCKYIILL